LLHWSSLGFFSCLGLFCGFKSDFAGCDRSDCAGCHSPCISVGQLTGSLGPRVGIGDNLGVVVGGSVGGWVGLSIGHIVEFWRGVLGISVGSLRGGNLGTWIGVTER